MNSVNDSQKGPAWQVAMIWLLQRLFKKKLTEGDGTIDPNHPIQYRDNLQTNYKSKPKDLGKEACERMFNEALSKLPASYRAGWDAIHTNHTASEIDQSVKRKISRESNHERKR